MSKRNKALVSRIWNEIWNEGALGVCNEVFAPEYVGCIPGMQQPVRGPEEFKQLVAVYRNAFPDVHLTVEDVFADGDRVAVRWTSRGTHRGELMGIPPTGRPIAIMGISLFQIKDGKIVCEWEGFDTMGMMQQLGLGGGNAPASESK